jgi:hypothetical protein
MSSGSPTLPIGTIAVASATSSSHPTGLNGARGDGVHAYAPCRQVQCGGSSERLERGLRGSVARLAGERPCGVGGDIDDAQRVVAAAPASRRGRQERRGDGVHPVCRSSELYDARVKTVQQIADLFGVPRSTMYGHLNKETTVSRQPKKKSLEKA